MNKKYNKCSAEMSEVVKLGYWENWNKGNTKMSDLKLFAELVLCENCFEEDKAEYWIKHKIIIKEKQTEQAIIKETLKDCGHVGDAYFTSPPNKCWQYCEKIFPPKYCDNKECPSSGIKGLTTQQEYNAGKCKKCQESESKLVSEQSGTSPTDTQKQRLNKSWWACQPTGTKAVIIGGSVILGIILIGVGYYIVRNRKKNAE